MLLGLGLLVLLDGPDHPPVPLLFAAFVEDLVEDVVQVVDGIHHFANVGRLELVRLRVPQGVDPPAQGVRPFDFEAVDVVGGIERVRPPGPAVLGVRRRLPCIRPQPSKNITPT
jgi:hypothetical protein